MRSVGLLIALLLCVVACSDDAESTLSQPITTNAPSTTVDSAPPSASSTTIQTPGPCKDDDPASAQVSRLGSDGLADISELRITTTPDGKRHVGVSLTNHDDSDSFDYMIEVCVGSRDRAVEYQDVPIAWNHVRPGSSSLESFMELSDDVPTDAEPYAYRVTKIRSQAQ
jgi:hypothetical protein